MERSIRINKYKIKTKQKILCTYSTNLIEHLKPRDKVKSGQLIDAVTIAICIRVLQKIIGYKIKNNNNAKNTHLKHTRDIVYYIEYMYMFKS